MMSPFRRLFAAALIFGAAFAGLNGRLSGQTAGRTVEWRTYGGDLASTRYSPLDQITPANFNTLEVAWRFKTDPLGPRPEFNFQSTPLMVGGVLFTTAGSRRSSRSTPRRASCAGCTARTKARAATPRPAGCPGAALRIGATDGTREFCM
jgi:hypothetical protein